MFTRSDYLLDYKVYKLLLEVNANYPDSKLPKKLLPCERLINWEIVKEVKLTNGEKR